MDSVSLQLVFLGTHDFDDFLRTRLLPRNGAFVEDAVIPIGYTMLTLREMLDERLIAQEWYRASVRKVPQRGGVMLRALDSVRHASHRGTILARRAAAGCGRANACCC